MNTSAVAAAALKDPAGRPLHPKRPNKKDAVTDKKPFIAKAKWAGAGWNTGGGGKGDKGGKGNKGDKGGKGNKGDKGGRGWNTAGGGWSKGSGKSDK